GKQAARKSPAQAGLFFNAMDGVYAENAGAFFGGCLDGATSRNEGAVFGCCKCGRMPEMQEQFPARRMKSLRAYGFGRRLWR
ncbi:MAG TPA: hypothetical protein VFE67_11205, partial [Rudaea sp.]|nr:hypothetical protein [Rudaea sp.]